VADGYLPKGPEDVLAAMVVMQDVAPDAAVGWAARGTSRWDIGHGFAGASSVEPIFDLASVTKPMTAVAFARSGLDRRIPLGDVLEEARGTASEDVTLELLLSHRAGLEAHLPLHEKLLLGGELDHATVLRIVADARRADAAGPIPPAGFAPVYSDLGYVLAGEALARTQAARDAGEAIEWLIVDALSSSIELGTARSLLAHDIRFETRVRKTEVVAWRGGEVRGQVHDENAWALTGLGGSGHAGMFGTVPAVLAFGCAVLDALKGRGGPFGETDLSWLVAERPGGTLRAGFDGKSRPGPNVYSSCGERASLATFGHLGFTGTSLWIDPEADAVVTLLTNRVHPTRENNAIRAARPIVHDQLFALAARAREA
jgi:CubicO group peptidase (beta-lactamase class C family)